MERARTEWLRSLGCEQDALLAEIGAVFVVVRANLEYKLPARFNDVLVLTVGIASMGRASVVVRQDVYRGRDAGWRVGAGLRPLFPERERRSRRVGVTSSCV